MKISQLENEVDTVKQKLNDSQKSEKEKADILEQLKSLYRAKKEKEDSLERIKDDIDKLAIERDHSVNLTGFYVPRIIFIFILILILIVILLLIIILKSSSTLYYISFIIGIIGIAFSAITIGTKLQILTPKVSFLKYKKEQYNCWDSRNPKYMDKIKQKGEIEKEIRELDSKIEEITQ